MPSRTPSQKKSWINKKQSVTAETLRELLQRRPFEPFEIHLTNGETHPIGHPEMAMLVGARLVVGYPTFGGGGLAGVEVFEFHSIDAMHLPSGIVICGRGGDTEFAVGDVFTELRWVTVQTTPRHYPF